MIGAITILQVRPSVLIRADPVPLRVTLAFALTALTYLHGSPNIANNFTFTTMFCELILAFWLYATLRQEATGGRAPVHEA